MNKTHKIVMRVLLDTAYDGVWSYNPCHYYAGFDIKDIQSAMDEWVKAWAGEDYDTPEFVIFATKGIRNGLDYALLSAEYEAWAWRFFVEGLFEDDDEGAEWNRILAEIERTYA